MSTLMDTVSKTDHVNRSIGHLCYKISQRYAQVRERIEDHARGQQVIKSFPSIEVLGHHSVAWSGERDGVHEDPLRQDLPDRRSIGLSVIDHFIHHHPGSTIRIRPDARCIGGWPVFDNDLPLAPCASKCNKSQKERDDRSLHRQGLTTTILDDTERKFPSMQIHNCPRCAAVCSTMNSIKVLKIHEAKN